MLEIAIFHWVIPEFSRQQKRSLSLWLVVSMSSATQLPASNASNMTTIQEGKHDKHSDSPAIWLMRPILAFLPPPSGKIGESLLDSTIKSNLLPRMDASDWLKQRWTNRRVKIIMTEALILIIVKNTMWAIFQNKGLYLTWPSICSVGELVVVHVTAGQIWGHRGDGSTESVHVEGEECQGCHFHNLGGEGSIHIGISKV